MLPCTTIRRVASILFACSLGLGGCASEPSPGSEADEAAVEDVSSALPLAAVSMTGATFAGLGLGVASSVNSLGTGATVGTNAATGTVGTSASINSSLGAGPTGFGSTFGTGPIGFSSSFGTGPIGFSTGNSTTVSSGTGSAPVIQRTCTGFGCP